MAGHPVLVVAGFVAGNLVLAAVQHRRVIPEDMVWWLGWGALLAWSARQARTRWNRPPQEPEPY